MKDSSLSAVLFYLKNSTGGKERMATEEKTNQFDMFQLDPNTLGDDWVFSGDQVHLNRPPKGKISDYNYYFAGPREAFRTKLIINL